MSSPKDPGQASANCMRQPVNGRLSSEVEVDNSNRIEESNSIRVEFAINFNRHDDLAKIEQTLGAKGLKLDSSNMSEKTIQVEIGADKLERDNVQSLQEFLEQRTGFTTVVKGLGQVASAVAELRPPPSFSSQPDSHDVEPVFGVVRLSQMTNGSCFVDGSIKRSMTRHFDESSARSNGSRHLLAIHESGDLTGHSFETIGRPLVKLLEQTVNTGNSESKKSNLLSIRQVVPSCDVMNMIGRSMALSQTDLSDNGNSSWQVLSAGVIARASTVGLNKKQVCTCSGKTLWEERVDRQQEK